jgi:lysophospholipase L1-like esterase
VPLLIGVEAVLRFMNVAPQPPEPLHIAGTARHYHAFLQQVDRIEEGGRLVRAYRGRVYSPAKTAGQRVVCLGGSTTWGHRLPVEDTWPAILEETLTEDGYDIEIINAARPWYTTAHSLVNYCLQMRRYDPDLVIIMHGINDLERSFPQPGEAGLEWDYGSYQGPMRHVLETYEQRQGRTGRRSAGFLEASAIYRLIRDQTALDRKFYGDLRRREESDEASGVDVGIDAFPTLDLFRSNLEYLIHLCLDDGCRVLLITQPHVYGGSDLTAVDAVPEVTRKHFLVTADGQPISRAGVRLGMRAIRDATLEVAADSAIPTVDVERVIGAQPGYFMDDLHLNAEGNREIAAAIAVTLGQIIDSAGPPPGSG